MNDVTIKVGRVSDVSDDSEQEQIRQVETIGGKAKPTFMLLPPGFCINIPLDSIVLMLSSDGQSEFGIPSKPWARFGNLKDLELKVGNILRRSNVFFCDDGQIYVNPNGTEKAEDWAIRYTKMEEAYNNLKADLNDLVQQHNTLLANYNTFVTAVAAHTHDSGTIPLPDNAAAMTPSSATGTASTSEMTEAKIEKVRLP